MKDGWSREFHEPIKAGSKTLRPLRDAGKHIASLASKVSAQPRWQTAVRELMMSAERNGILWLAEIAMLLAINYGSESKQGQRNG
jgi:hypothetical protein